MGHFPSDIPEAEFIRLFEELGCAGMSRRTGITQRAIYQRRETLEKKYKRQITPPQTYNTARHGIAHPGRINIELLGGTVLIGSDWHIWPGAASLMHRAFVKFCKETKPAVVIANGDVLDLGQISRHPPIGWDELPDVYDEIEAGQERLAEIEAAAFKARKIWTLGNHDGRYETRLATVAPEFRRIPGFSLKDHFPLWEPCWRIDLNENVVIKHRGKGGKHDSYNNALHAGVTCITGHTHHPYVRAITDARGDRYGVNSGMIADPDDPSFLDYTEDSPYKDWRAAFVVLTFHKGRLLMPELVSQWDKEHVQFRGEIIRV